MAIEGAVCRVPGPVLPGLGWRCTVWVHGVLVRGLELVMTAAAEPIRIRSAAQLRRTVESPELGLRLAALNAIQQQPAKALAFGVHDGEDVIDMLLSSVKRAEGTLEWLYYVIALAAFRDARVTDFYTTILATSTDSELLFTAAEYLAASLNPAVEYTCRRLLWDEHPGRIRAVVSLLSGSKLLDDAERIRIGILAPSDHTQLPAFAEARELWLRELNGPFRVDAQICLERQGLETLDELLTAWKSLAEQNREWLVDWVLRSEVSP